MADKFIGRGDFSIPSELYDEHEWMTDYLLDGELSTTCSLVYPPTDSECPNCIFDPAMGRSSNIYKPGGPIPFTDHTVCPWCGGQGRKIEDVRESIKLRVYWGGMEVNAAMKQFSKMSSFDVPDGLIFIIGYMYDLPKFERAASVLVNTPVAVREWR